MKDILSIQAFSDDLSRSNHKFLNQNLFHKRSIRYESWLMEYPGLWYSCKRSDSNQVIKYLDWVFMLQFEMMAWWIGHLVDKESIQWISTQVSNKATGDHFLKDRWKEMDKKWPLFQNTTFNVMTNFQHNMLKQCLESKIK